MDQNGSNHCDPDGRFSCARCGRLYKWKQARNRHLKYECGVKPQFSVSERILCIIFKTVEKL